MLKITPALCLVLLANAASAAESTAPAAQASAADGAATYAAVPRLEFNRQAVVRDLPLFWVRDADADSTLDPDELAVTWGPGNASLGRYVKDGSFTPEFAAAYALIAQPVSLDGLAAAEKTRRQAVLEELGPGPPDAGAHDAHRSRATRNSSDTSRAPRASSNASSRGRKASTASPPASRLATPLRARSSSATRARSAKRRRRRTTRTAAQWRRGRRTSRACTRHRSRPTPVSARRSRSARTPLRCSTSSRS